MNKITKQKFDKIVCQLVLPYSIRVPEEHYNFSDKNVQVDLIFRRYVRSNPNDQLNIYANNQIIEKERFGRHDYSIVDIILEKKYFEYSPIFETHQLKVFALGIVRKFIQFYKLTYDEYWLIEPSINDILSFTIKCYDGNKEIRGCVGSFIDTPSGNKIIGISA